MLKDFAELSTLAGVFFDIADWFSIAESEVILATGKRQGIPFAAQKALENKKGRRVFLVSSPDRPVSNVYPRTSKNNGGHSAHHDCLSSCKIDRDGEIIRYLPCTVKTKNLTIESYSCSEENNDLIKQFRLSA